jgi:Rrf2 family protein
MLSSSRFIVAVHVLTILAREAGKGPVCSKSLAKSIDTNPVVIRRLMSELEKSKLVKSTAGRAGGFQLCPEACGVTLADIYDAVEDKTVFRMHKLNPANECPTAEAVQKALEPILRNAEQALSESLRNTTLKQVSDGMGMLISI